MKTEQLTKSDKATLKHKFLTQAKCAQRYEDLLREYGYEVPQRIDTLCTLEFADQELPIDFEKLLTSDNYTFIHDMAGLDRHMNRETCKLEGGFVPRCCFHS